jgi:acyl-CoA reductase-like NAD-dependent aldehyde dehydrogenase
MARAQTGTTTKATSATTSAATAKTAPPALHDATSARASVVPVLKTYKLFIGGKFPRSESGRTYPVRGPRGDFLANAAQASRKDARDAVVAARKAFGSWSHATAYNRGQVVYRIAEMLQGRRAEFVELLVSGEGAKPKAAAATVDAAIDRLVHYAGWTDKIAAVFGSSNPVAGPFFSFSTPEPTGVVAAFAPQQDSLLGLVSVIAPIICSGNTAVVVTSRAFPLPAVTLSEVLATSDVPGGVVNILTGDAAELGTHLAAHADVNALDLTGVDGDLRTALARDAAGTVKRVYVPKQAADFTRTPGTARLRAFLETKTVWHPTGAVSLAGGTSY